MDNSKIIQHLRAMPTSDLMMQAADVIEQQDRLIEAIGAGGVSGQRITNDYRIMRLLQSCEKAYMKMILDGSPEACDQHDKARAAFWEAL